MPEYSINQRVAERVRSGESLDGKQFQKGDCVALLDGKVVAVTKNLDAALEGLRSLDPDPNRGMIFIVSPHVMDIIRKVA